MVWQKTGADETQHQLLFTYQQQFRLTERR